MELTFMPRKAQSLNFLEKFKGKLNRVDRHSGILGVLYGKSQRYQSITDHSIHTSITNSRTIEEHPSTPIIPKQRNRIPTHCLAAHPLDDPLRKTRAFRIYLPHKGHPAGEDKENRNDCNLQATRKLLPKLDSRLSVNSKDCNTLKSRILPFKQTKASYLRANPRHSSKPRAFSSNSQEAL